jgi:hypothetical protein
LIKVVAKSHANGPRAVCRRSFEEVLTIDVQLRTLIGQIFYVNLNTQTCIGG